MINFWTVKVIRFVTIFFVVAVIAASYFYPGGNIHDSNQLGYSFTHNFLSDLGGLESHSGEDNIISSIFFNLSMLFFFFIPIIIAWFHTKVQTRMQFSPAAQILKYFHLQI